VNWSHGRRGAHRRKTDGYRGQRKRKLDVRETRVPARIRKNANDEQQSAGCDPSPDAACKRASELYLAAAPTESQIGCRAETALIASKSRVTSMSFV